MTLLRHDADANLYPSLEHLGLFSRWEAGELLKERRVKKVRLHKPSDAGLRLQAKYFESVGDEVEDNDEEPAWEVYEGRVH